MLSLGCCSTLTCPALPAAQPVHLHGSLGREAATGRGVLFATRELLKATHAGKIADQTYVIQVGRQLLPPGHQRCCRSGADPAGLAGMLCLPAASHR